MTLYIPLFRSCSNLRSLTQLHAHLVVSGLLKGALASTKLIESYAQMGSLKSSRLVFDTFPSPDSFMWGVLMKSYLWSHFFEEVVLLYHNMIYHHAHIGSFVYPSVLRACSAVRDLGIGRKVHGRVVKLGHDADTVIETTLLGMYGELGCLNDARKLFDEMGERDVVCWSCIISSYIENGQAREGLEMLRRMLSEGIKPDWVIMLSIAEACANVGSFMLAKSIHGHAIVNEIMANGNFNSSLIFMYSQCGSLSSAERIFLSLPDRSTSSWTSMISSYNQNGCFQEAVDTFKEMQESKVEPNAVTMLSVLGSCARLALLNQGQSVHCVVLRKAIDPEFDLLGPALIDFYAACWKLSICQKLLHFIGENNVVSWNIVISFYGREGLYKDAVVLFAQLLAKGLMPDSFSLSSSISASASLGSIEVGQQIHCHVMKRGIIDEFVQNSLIDMYSKCGFVDLACLIFRKSTQKSVVTWNCMICGFSQNGNSVEALNLFDEMYLNCLEINDVTFLSAIQACSNLGNLERGKWIHHKIVISGLQRDLYIATALTDMYAKCGDLQTAQGVFDSMPEKSVVSWSIMIDAFGMHGRITSAISLFTEMVEAGVKPNEVTFMNVLSACSHAGAVEEGKFYFSMMRDYGIEPDINHFVSIVDLLSRAGDVNGAYEIIKSMHLPVDASIWGALLNGCRIHRRMDMIETIKRELIEIRTDDTGFYTLLSNIYAEEINWGESGKLRSMMEDTGLKKVPGYSTIEIDKRIYRFGAGDTSDWQMKEMHTFFESFQSFTQAQRFDVECFGPTYGTAMFSEDSNVYKLQSEASNSIWNKSIPV